MRSTRIERIHRDTVRVAHMLIVYYGSLRFQQDLLNKKIQ